MQEYKVKIIERLATTVPVQGKSANQAEDRVRDMYRNSEIVLTADDYVDTEFEVICETAASTCNGQCSCGSREFEVKEVTSTIIRGFTGNGILEYVQGTEQMQSIVHVGPFRCPNCGTLYLSLDGSEELDKTAPSAAGTNSPKNEKPPLREVYVKVGTETTNGVPAEFTEYNTFWAQHQDDTGFVLIYLDSENRIVD